MIARPSFLELDGIPRANRGRTNTKHSALRIADAIVLYQLTCTSTEGEVVMFVLQINWGNATILWPATHDHSTDTRS